MGVKDAARIKVVIKLDGLANGKGVWIVEVEGTDFRSWVDGLDWVVFMGQVYLKGRSNG